MKHIVIAGGGFAGVNCALQLHRTLPKNADAKITLVDQRGYHLMPGYLYEVASSPEELAGLAQLKQSITVPFEQIFAGTRVKVEQQRIMHVDVEKQELVCTHQTIPFDYLVLTLGSTSNFYGIPGADKFALPLKSAHDSLTIRNRIQFLFDTHRMDTTKPLLRFVVAGGGFAGVEMAGELKGLLDFLSWKEQYPRHKMEIVVVEGTNQLMPGMDEFVGKDVYARLRSLGVTIMLNAMISAVDEQFLSFKDGEKISYNCLIWTAGVKANQAPLAEGTEFATDKNGRVMTNARFQVDQHPNIFVAGDETCYIGIDGKPLPGTARQAIDQGKYLGHALASIVQNKQPMAYECKTYGYIVPVGGKWAIFRTPRLYLKGFWPYVFRQLGWFHYYWTILGLRRAIQFSFLQNKLYGRNDD